MRQNVNPIDFPVSTRVDNLSGVTSGFAGQVVPLGYIPMFRGDSLSGSVRAVIKLAEMPRPLVNSTIFRFQSWFVPAMSHPRYSSVEDFLAAYQGTDIEALNTATRSAPPLYEMLTGTDLSDFDNSPFAKTLGIISGGRPVNTALIDAFIQVYNFRLAAHSSKLARHDYASEDLPASLGRKRAFWPSGPNSAIVADYEAALINGALDLDLVAGRIPISSYHRLDGTVTHDGPTAPGASPASTTMTEIDDVWHFEDIIAEMAGQRIVTTLADIERARQTQTFAKYRSTLAGSDVSGFDNDDAIVADLMQGFKIDIGLERRPWLLDSKMGIVGLQERNATDGASLDQSVTVGQSEARLSLNVPKTQSGGYVVYTVEVMPERIWVRSGDPLLHVAGVDDLPNAQRDSMRIPPVDTVDNHRMDTLHSTPDAIYGFEPMNHRHNRNRTMFGGVFRQDTPGTPITNQRHALWQPQYIDPVYTDDHFLCPFPFPNDVFSLTTAPSFEVDVRHDTSIRGLTQIGDVLNEANDDYQSVVDAREEA